MGFLNAIPKIEGSRFPKKRRGRGDATGLGGTAGKGHKGQKARTGGRVRRGFEGGQMPLHRRMPKFGFNNIFRVSYNVVNLDDISKLTGEINPEVLRAAGLVTSPGPIKVLGGGKVSRALTVQANKFSAAAKIAIEAAGGKTEEIK